MSEQRSAPRVAMSTRATVSDGRRSAEFTVDSLSVRQTLEHIAIDDEGEA